MRYQDLKRYGLLNDHLTSAVTIKEILELEANSKANNEKCDKWVEKFLTSVQPLLWSKWLKIIYGTGKIPVFKDFSRFSKTYEKTGAPHHYKDWENWFEMLETEPSGFLNKREFYLFPNSEWLTTEGELPNSFDDFCKKANNIVCRKYITHFICWYFNTEAKNTKKFMFNNFNKKNLSNNYKQNREGLEDDPSSFFWGVKSIKNYNYNNKNARKQLKLTDELISLVIKIFNQN